MKLAQQAGWYDDPNVPGQQRWWDGCGWTIQVRPVRSDAKKPCSGWTSTFWDSHNRASAFPATGSLNVHHRWVVDPAPCYFRRRRRTPCGVPLGRLYCPDYWLVHARERSQVMGAHQGEATRSYRRWCQCGEHAGVANCDRGDGSGHAEAAGNADVSSRCCTAPRTFRNSVPEPPTTVPVTQSETTSEPAPVTPTVAAPATASAHPSQETTPAPLPTPTVAAQATEPPPPGQETTTAPLPAPTTSPTSTVDSSNLADRYTQALLAKIHATSFAETCGRSVSQGGNAWACDIDHLNSPEAHFIEIYLTPQADFGVDTGAAPTIFGLVTVSAPDLCVTHFAAIAADGQRKDWYFPPRTCAGR